MNDKGKKLLAGTSENLVWKIERKIAEVLIRTFTSNF